MILNEKRNRCLWTRGRYPTPPPFEAQKSGGETGSTRMVKVFSCIRHGSAVIGLKKINANDNFAPVAKAA